ncbi:hypothetical protein DCC85_11920 [Paenibacillus sp. CAA11]|uniref:hypothetical protein n=1 Tax=Paenibacillus sp. CAA11 TaxID=1532905 RepID=UPI000D3B3446|nr:hypothetical protein [Paenibacillus sp. CAA11]AWB44855.1 hypothetical protein DCC85_11920 [Paenibacillus sp. CAA11]
MSGHVKQMLWIAASLALWVGAAVYALQGLDLAKKGLQSIEVSKQNQKGIINTQSTALTTDIEIYLGTQIFYLWRDHYEQSLEIEVDGHKLEKAVEAPEDKIIASTVPWIDLAGKYRASYERNDRGNITRIEFTRE